MAGEAIFIGYRRDDTADVAGRIHDALEARFGRDRIFKDVDNIPVGANFGQYITSILPRCRVALILMGPHWVDARDASGKRRLEDPNDWVRIEVETALDTPDLQVVPVLVNGAQMPRAEDVPDALQPILHLNAAVIRRDPDFRDDIERLVKALQRSGRIEVEAPKRTEVERQWEALETSQDAEDLLRFADSFPGSAQSLEARRRAAQLQAQAQREWERIEYNNAREQERSEREREVRWHITNALVEFGPWLLAPAFFLLMIGSGSNILANFLVAVVLLIVTRPLARWPVVYFWVLLLLFLLALISYIGGAISAPPSVMRERASGTEAPVTLVQPRPVEALVIDARVSSDVEASHPEQDTLVFAGTSAGFSLRYSRAQNNSLVIDLVSGQRNYQPCEPVLISGNGRSWCHYRDLSPGDYTFRAIVDGTLVATKSFVISPVPPATTCADQWFVIYFEWDSDTLNAAAVEAISDAVEKLRGCQLSGATVIGYADTSQTEERSDILSRARANQVTVALHDRGINAELITTEAYGEAVPARMTSDGVREPLNRRVLVHLDAR